MNFCRFSYIRIAVVLCLCLAAWQVQSRDYVKVVDGDSLEIGRRRIRLLGIDAPEYRQFCFDAQKQKYECGKESRAYLDKMLKNARYKVDCRAQKTDIYKRELAECFIGKTNLNLEMLKAGWAVVYRSDDEAYLRAEKKARKQQKGIWQGKFLRPEYYRRLNRR